MRKPAGTTLAVAAVLAVLGAAPAPDEYRAAVEAWRAEREAGLRGDDGWLAVAGLYWLRPGANRFGAAAGNEIVLPAGSVPERAGALTLEQGRVRVRLEPGVDASVGGVVVASERELKSDQPGPPDVLALGRLRLTVIERSGRLGVRVKDPGNARRRAFTGLRWYPVDPTYRVAARFVPASGPRTIAVPNVLGDVLEMPSPGHVEFTLQGRALRLDPVLEGDSPQLFFIFRDTTAAKETYGAGRFLYADPPAGGTVTLDFNRAYSPPCAYTDFATCPLPPKQNRLDVAITAGEKTPPGAH